MSRLIVIEGPDGAGKSTLIRKLSNDMGRELFHTGGPKTEEEMQRWRQRIREVAKQPMIADRVPFISDQIYQPLYDNHGPFDHLTHEIIELDPVIVYCRLQSVPAMLELMDRTLKPHKPQWHIDLLTANYSALVQRYDDILEKLRLTGMDVFRYDWMQDSYDNLLRNLHTCAD